MTSAERETVAAIRAAALVSGVMIAFQVAGRATRDALFLSTHPVTALPTMIMVGSAAAILAAALVSRPLARFGPERVVSALFAGSAALLLAEWALLLAAPAAAAVAVFIHVNALGALLVSGFWSVVNERFDPRTAKRAVGTIGAAGTLGGVAGGLLAERAAVLLSVPAMLPLLALLHVAGAVLLTRLATGRAAAARAGAEDAGLTAGLRVIAGNRYVRIIVAVVLLSTLAEGLLDYVFKTQARASTASGPALLRLFALFYTAVSLLSVAAQAGFSRRALAGLGLARTVGVLPWVTAVGSAGALALPGLVSAMLARGAEAVARNSLYRSGFELLFTPLPPSQKRSTKPLIDVGVLRIGDVVAAGLVQLALLTAGGSALTVMLVLATAFAAAGIMLTLPLHIGYVATLERSLVSRAVQLELDDIQDETTRSTLLQTIGAAPRAAAVAPATPEPVVSGEAGPHSLAPPDPVLGRIGRLRARDPEVVRRALAARPLEAAHVPHAIALLAWDEVAPDALRALQAVAARYCGQLVDGLLDPDQEFTVRRRLPDALAHARTARAVDGLLGGLADRRFEVRFRCGRALVRLLAAAPDLAVPAERVYAAVEREVGVDRQVWESQRLLDRVPDDAEAGFVDEVLQDRASRSLEHVFTVLSLALPRQPLQLAFRGLHTDDAHLRGTALEYLEAALPDAVRERLWPFLDDRSRRRDGGGVRQRDAIVADLLRSQESIALNLQALRERRLGGA